MVRTNFYLYAQIRNMKYQYFCTDLLRNCNPENILRSTGTKPQEHIAWWRRQMETFSALLALCAGNSPVPVNSPHKGQWRGALMFSLICVRINDWVNNREAGDVRRHRGHYDVSVMAKHGAWYISCDVLYSARNVPRYHIMLVMLILSALTDWLDVFSHILQLIRSQEMWQ